MARKPKSINEQCEELTAKMAKLAATGKLGLAEDLLEAMFELGRQAGKNDVIIDLWDTKQLEEEALEFAIENNGAADPRKNRG